MIVHSALGVDPGRPLERSPVAHKAAGPVDTFSPSEEEEKKTSPIYWVGLMNAVNGLMFATLLEQPLLGYSLGLSGACLMMLGQKSFNVGPLNVINGMTFAGLLDMPVVGAALGGSGIALSLYNELT